MPELRVLTLGRLSVVVDGVEVPALPNQPVRAALLVFLALERSTTRDAAIGCIWPDQPFRRARHALSQTLYQLRRDLGDGWIATTGAYLRCTETVSVDALDLAAAVEAGRWQEALTLYGGGFLTACFLVSSTGFQQWTDRHCARIDSLHRRARIARIDELSDRGELDAAVRCAREWLRMSPSDDEACQRVMRLLHTKGDRGAALRQYEQFVHFLSRDEDEPMPETAALASAIASVPPPSPRLVGGLPDSSLHDAKDVNPPTEARPGRRRIRPRMRAAAFTTAAMILAAIVLFVVASEPHEAVIHSLAVLPYESADPNGVPAYFAEGVQDGLIAELARASDLRILSRTSTIVPAATRPSAVARHLGVDATLRTDLRRAGDSVEVRVTLLDADGRLVARAQAARPLAETPDLLAGIAGSLARQVTGENRAATRQPLPPVDREAYDRFLRAEHLVRELRTENWLAAGALYESAIAADSTFGPAYAGVALAEFAAGLFGSAPRSRAWPRARSWAMRAVERDSALAGAHTVLGFVALFDDWDWGTADSELLQALRLDRNDIMARHAYADLLTLRGEAEAGLHQIELARAVDPLSPLTNGPLLGHLYVARRFQEVVDSVPVLRERYGRPDFAATFMAASLWRLDRRDEALEEFRTAYGWRSNGPLSRSVAQGYDAGGPRSALRAAADFEARRWRPGDGSAYDIARLYGHAGATAEAFLWLERAYEERPPDFIHFTTEPTFDALHPDPRFASLLRRVGLDPATGLPLASR